MPPPPCSSPPYPTASLPPPAAHSPSGGWPLPQPCPQSPLTRRHLSTEPQADPRKSQVLSPAFTDHRPELPSAPRPPPGPPSSTATTLVLGIQVSPYSIRGEGVHPKRSQKRSAPVLIRPVTPPSRYGRKLIPAPAQLPLGSKNEPRQAPCYSAVHSLHREPAQPCEPRLRHPPPPQASTQSGLGICLPTPATQHWLRAWGAPGRAEDWG